MDKQEYPVCEVKDCVGYGTAHGPNDDLDELAERHQLVAMAIRETLEVRLGSPGTRSESGVYVYCGVVLDNGAIHHMLSPLGIGVSCSLSNLQIKKPVPQKAVKGWQAEMVDVLRTGIYRVEEVR
jgi:hypothetical protein